MRDHDGMRWERASRVCAEVAAVREEVERRTVFDDFMDPVQLIVKGPPLVVERDGSVVIACNVILRDRMQLRVVEFRPDEWSVIDSHRRNGAPLLNMWWEVCRAGGTSVVMRQFANWIEKSRIAEKSGIDLESMYGSSALEG